MTQRYVLGQGKVYIDTISATTGLPEGNARFVGNVPNGGLVVNFTTQAIEHYESYTGQNLKDKVIERQKQAKATLTLENIVKENLMLAIYGSDASLASATVTSAPHVAHPGKAFFLGRPNLTSFTSLTSTGGSPTTYVNGTDYTVDLKSGTVEIIEGGAISTQTNVLTTYVAGAIERVTAFSADNTEVWLRFNGLNNADENKPIVFDAFKVRLMPLKALDLISDQWTKLEMDAELLYQDLLDGVTGYDGGFFRIMQTVAA